MNAVCTRAQAGQKIYLYKRGYRLFSNDHQGHYGMAGTATVHRGDSYCLSTTGYNCKSHQNTGYRWDAAYLSPFLEGASFMVVAGRFSDLWTKVIIHRPTDRRFPCMYTVLFPDYSGRRWSFPFTAAGQFRNYTGFPMLSLL